MRLDKFIAKCGYGSRKDAKKLLKDGLIKVDGNIIRDASFHIDPTCHAIEIKDIKIEYKEFVYIMLNKPCGVVSATADGKYETVVDIVADQYGHYKLFPAGRLDRDSEGFVLLTNDGKLAHNITAPGRRVPKLYFVKIDRPVNDSDIEAFETGLILDDGSVTLPAKLEIDEDIPIHCYVTIHEGKFHQIKRMFKALGRNVLKLKRLKIGDLELDPDLKPGEYRELTDVELERLIESEPM